jgi:hypothetical protein
MVKLLSLLLYVLVLTSCGILPIEGRYFWSKDAVSQHLEKNKSAFQQVVDRWQKTNPKGNFSYWVADSHSFVWNDIRILPQENGYQVSNGGQVLLSNASFQQACERALVAESELLWWREQAEALKIYYISYVGKILPVEEQFIQITLRGSELKPYGLIYVPAEGNKAFASLQYDARMKHPPPGYTKLDYVEGRWFYFEEKY